MYIIIATFEAEQAFARASELLALGDAPERLAERLGIMRDVAVVKEGVAVTSFKRLINDLARLKQFIEIEKQIEEVEGDKSMLRFLGAKFKEKQLAKLQNERRKFGSLIEAPRWFYKQPRVQLLSAIRDYALDGSQQGDATWSDVDEKKLVFPIAEMFEAADTVFAETLIAQLEKPLKDVDPHFLLEKFEGNRSITFDFKTSMATYYAPAPAHGTA
ncbi:MAG TPA: hypothetical protein VGC39_06495 [Candidatus Methylacidiphilales bacterium]